MATKVFLTIVAGLVLFFFAVNNLSEILQKIIGENAKKYIEKIEEVTSVRVGIVSTSPERDDTIIRG